MPHEFGQMMAKDFNAPHVVEGYDQHIQQLIPAYALMHLQVQSILACDYPNARHFLIVGVGTGYELHDLLSRYPKAQFTALDPAANMLQHARQQCSAQQHRIRFIESTLQDFQTEQQFDVVLILLVSHFVQDKSCFWQKAYQLLRVGGIVISYDLMQPEPQELGYLKQLCQHQGLSQTQANRMLQRLEDDFFLLDAYDYQQQLIQVGFKHIYCYLKVLCYAGWLAKK